MNSWIHKSLDAIYATGETHPPKVAENSSFFPNNVVIRTATVTAYNRTAVDNSALTVSQSHSSFD